MPRSYSFDHFQAINAEKVTGVRNFEKQAVAQQEGSSLERTPGIHYGKRHAQTEQRFQAHQRERQLEALSGVDRRAPKRADPALEPLPVPQLLRGLPIGAVPEPQEPPAQGHFQEISDEAGRHLSVLRVATTDLVRASWRLLTLPLRAAQLAAHRWART